MASSTKQKAKRSRLILPLALPDGEDAVAVIILTAQRRVARPVPLAAHAATALASTQDAPRVSFRLKMRSSGAKMSPNAKLGPCTRVRVSLRRLGGTGIACAYAGAPLFVEVALPLRQHGAIASQTVSG